MFENPASNCYQPYGEESSTIYQNHMCIYHLTSKNFHKDTLGKMQNDT
jgi:hypothetical protein